ncbi:MAG: phosphate acyltransferase PlsX [Chloroflexota bacterium]
MRIVLDAMGSDNYPGPEVQGAVEAAEKFGDEILLVGKEPVLAPLLKQQNPQNAPVKIIHAPEVFEMAAKISGSALRRSQNSMGVGMDLLKNGEADAFVTAGNTGGAMAIGLSRLGRIRGVKRPALCALIPVKGGQAVILDIGANAICKPEFMAQFAIMGSLYAKAVLSIQNPRVGLVSNGEEAGKGNELVKESYHHLEELDLNFIGNVEGKEFYGGEVDVAVTDGFTGNVFIKASEAVAKLLIDELKDSLLSTTRTKIGGFLAKPAFETLREMLDPASVGAVPLLGLDGLVFVGHGRSSAKALVSAISRARQAAEIDLLGSLKDEITKGLK